MANQAGYRILDEPTPSTHAALSVNPFWILLGVMLGGVWLSWPWFVFNAFAIGSATRKRELALIVFGLLGSFLLVGLGAALIERSVIDERSIRYAAIVLVVWKLAVSYTLYATQARSHQLYEYFGGTSKNGALVLAAGFLARGVVLKHLSGVWLAVLA